MSVTEDKSYISRVKSRIFALVAGVGIALIAILTFSVTLPAQGESAPNKAIGYVYSGPKSESVDFSVASMTDDAILMFGSSELSTSKKLIPQVPAAVFGEHDYGVQFVYVGEAFDQSLWHTIALGAYAGAELPSNKVVISVGPGWFVDGGLDNETFGMRFSYNLYRLFMANPRISDTTKEYVTERLREQGVDDTQIDAATGEYLQDGLNDAAFATIDDWSIRSDLRDVRLEAEESAAALATATDVNNDPSLGETHAADELERPDFEALRTAAYEDALAATTSNPYGLEDRFWEEELGPVWDEAEGMRAGETFSDTPEYDDLAAFLTVCRELGLEPLVVISPVFGPYYDHIGVSAEARAHCYEAIRSIAEAAGAKVADFSAYEYEPYFLFDIVHFGWLGWAAVDEALYDFAMGESS